MCPRARLTPGSQSSTYIRKSALLREHAAQPVAGRRNQRRARAGRLGDSVTTDHISPAGSIKQDSPAGKYLIAHGVQPADFNSYGSRRGNHEVMMRGTFANVRLRNKMVAKSKARSRAICRMARK